VGDGVATAAIPVPVRLTLCRPPAALSVKLTAAVRVPLARGLKVTLTVQLAPAATLVPQLLVWAKSPEFVPATAIPVMLKAALPVLWIVTGCGGLVTPTGSFPSARLVGEALKAGLVLVPVPERITLCGLPVALSVKVTAAARAPVVVGLKVTLTVQMAPAALLAPQLLVWAKSPEFVPVIAMLVMLKAALPVLLRVIACGELGAPTD